MFTLHVGPGDEVILPDMTWIASSAPISYLGATLVFADVDPETSCLCTDAFESVIEPSPTRGRWLPTAHHIEKIQRSSIAPEVVAEVQQQAADYPRLLVCLDSNHTHEHVLAESEAYAPLVSLGSYCVVHDTAI